MALPAAARRADRRIRLRTLLTAGMLVPILGVGVLSAVLVAGRWDDHERSRWLATQAEELTATLDVVAALSQEQTLSSLVSLSAQYGLPVSASALAALEDARGRLDAADVDRSVHTAFDQVREIRDQVDAGTATFQILTEVYADAADRLNAVWVAQLAETIRGADEGGQPAWLRGRLQNVEESIEALEPTVRRVRSAARANLAIAEPADVDELFEAEAAFAAAMRRIEPDPGSGAEEALQRFRADPAAQRIEAAIAQGVEVVLGGAGPRYTGDPAIVVADLQDAVRWSALLADVVRGSVSDLRDAAIADAAADRAEVRGWFAAGAGVVILAIGTSLYTARRLVAPAHELSIAARRAVAGDFDVDPVRRHGPREVVDVVDALNAVMATLRAVEARAVALVEHPTSDVHGDPLPGRTGAALQEALDRLRAAMCESDRQRAALAVLATSDELTGLLNRRGAFEAMQRALDRAARDGDRLAVLYLDLDGLKSLNDRYGHATGDVALRRCAEAIRAVVRDVDLVSRVGGDEFVVAVTVAPGDLATPELLARRIRERLSSTAIEAGDQLVVLSCSIGIALSEDGATDVDVLLAAADDALYTAKEQGRDRIAW